MRENWDPQSESVTLAPERRVTGLCKVPQALLSFPHTPSAQALESGMFSSPWEDGAMLEAQGTAGKTSARKASSLAPGPVTRALIRRARSRLKVRTNPCGFCSNPQHRVAEETAPGNAYLLAAEGVCSRHATCDWSVLLEDPPTSPAAF